MVKVNKKYAARGWVRRNEVALDRCSADIAGSTEELSAEIISQITATVDY
jgi:hypothetical protein